MNITTLIQRLSQISQPSSRLTLPDILKRGYFPRELPPPFNTDSFSNVITAKGLTLPTEFTAKKDKWCDYTTYSLARPGSLRRRLAIVNPLAYYKICAEIVKHQDALFKKTSPSVVCLSQPETTPRGPRAIGTRIALSELPAARARSRVGRRFALRTDISRFYPSIYTHALDWAITGKKKAKANFGKHVDRLGKRIDFLIQAAQNGQTRGIPIGPDASLLLAHILLAPVDRELKRKKVTQGFRFMDDYELVFADRSEAEQALAILEEALSEFELELNPLKTGIFELPQEIDNPAIVSLREHHLSEDEHAGTSSLVSFFNKAFEYANTHPNKPILRFAVGRINKLAQFKHQKLTQDLVLQCATVEPGVWPRAIPILLRLHDSTFLSKEPIRNVIEATLLQQAPRQHSSEVAWALWAALVFNISISRKATKEVIKMEDNACKLLLLHTKAEGLATFDAWCNKHIKKGATATDLYQENWLFAYESVVKGWVSPSTNYVASDSVFGFLATESVSFYDTTELTRSRIVPEETESGYDSFDYSEAETEDELLQLLDELVDE